MQKVKLRVYENVVEVARIISKRIKSLIVGKKGEYRKIVLCLPSGETPKPIYKELVRLHQEEKLSFRNVVVLSPGDYFQIEKNDKNSSFSYLRRYLFDHVDISEENIHLPRGDMKIEEYDEYCMEYEQMIDSFGGITLTLLGIGKTGHIAFNEPGSGLKDLTRIVPLHLQTRKDTRKNFTSLEDVPKFAISLGIGTIVKKSKEIIVVATGYHKSKIVQKTVESQINSKTVTSAFRIPPACFLQFHQNCTIITDRPAGSRTKAVRCPWSITKGSLAAKYEWHFAGDEPNNVGSTSSKLDTVSQAVVWLSRYTNIPILALSELDFHNHGLSSLCYHANGNVEDLCARVYHLLLSRIHSDRNLLLPVGKDRRILIFSPHPDDEVISLGGLIGTISLEHKNKNVHIAYMTSGSRAISKNVMKRHLRFTFSAMKIMGVGKKESKTAIDKVKRELEHTKDYEPDSAFIQELKKNIRQAEALNGLEVLGLGTESAHFLDLPFYRTGKDKKKEPGEEDLNIILDCLREVNPTDVVVCFDLEDPHGTHSLCYWISKKAVERYEELEKRKVKKYLYKGAWQEFEPFQCSIFCPMTKKMMDLKIDSIFQHGSQKDKPMFPGDDNREFHIRAKERNLKTAKVLKELGLPGYYACEGLKVVQELPNSIMI